MERGWDATGRLEQLIARHGNLQELANVTGIGYQTLSMYNQGRRNLGWKNARKIAAATGISLRALGAPTPPPLQADRLEQIAGGVDELHSATTTIVETLAELLVRLKAVQAALAPRARREAQGSR